MPVPFSPIFIVGVPRSGTTLLRVLLDSHSQILALPETPWVTGAYGGPLSLRQLLLDLAEGPYGAARNVAGIERAHILEAGAGFLEQLFVPALAARNKSVVAFKTPSDIPHLEFLTALLPQARYIHITRDGRDVALSQLAKKGSFFLELRGYRSLSYANVFRRWVEWEQKARAVLCRDGLNVCHLRYEDLIADPESELRRMMAFLELPFEPRMLDYAAHSHDYPKWEAGSSDVVQRRAVSDASVGKWQRQAKTIEVLHTLTRYDEFLVSLGYPSSGVSPGRVQGLVVAGYGLVRPVLEILALLARRARPLMRSPARVLACCFLLLLAVQSFIPLRGWAGETIGALLCFGAAFSVAIGFAPALLRHGGPAVAQVAAGMLAYLILLAAGALLLTGKYPDPNAFLLNTAAILVASAAASLSKPRQRAA
jgi:hypothetical protein